MREEMTNVSLELAPAGEIRSSVAAETCRAPWAGAALNVVVTEDMPVWTGQWKLNHKIDSVFLGMNRIMWSLFLRLFAASIMRAFV